MLLTFFISFAILHLLPDASGLSDVDKVKEIIICILVCGLAMISNVLNVVALVLWKNR